MFFSFSRISSWLAFFPPLSLPSKRKKNMDSGRKKKVIEAYHIMERKALKMGAPSIRTAGAARATKPGWHGERSQRLLFSMRWKRWRPGRFNMGSSWKGAWWGFKKTCLFFYLSCFKFALVRIWSQNLPVKIGYSPFFWGGNECAKWPTRIRCMEISREGEYLDTSNWLKQIEEKTSLAPYQYHHFPEHHFLRTFLGEPKSWDLKDFQHSNPHLLQESI